MRRNLSAVLIAIFILGCSSAPKEIPNFSQGVVRSIATNQLRVGMSREEVSILLGPPSLSAADGTMEVLRFRQVVNDPRKVYAAGMENFFVKFDSGRVTQYGKIGDFGSTRNPTMDVNVRVEE